MDRVKLYEQTKLFMKPRWWDIFFIRLLYGTLTFIIMSALVTLVFDPTWFTSLRFVTHFDSDSLELFFTSVAASSALSSLIVGVVNGALTMSILKSYQDNTPVRFSDVYKTIKKNFLKLFCALLVIAIVQFILTIIPYVKLISIITLPFVNYVTAFTFFLIVDDASLNGPQAVWLSMKETNHHKMNLLIITIHYYLRKVVGYVIVLLGFVFITIGLILSDRSISSSVFMMLGFAKVSIGIAVNIFMAIKFGPYATVAHAIYYEQVKRT